MNPTICFGSELNQAGKHKTQLTMQITASTHCSKAPEEMTVKYGSLTIIRVILSPIYLSVFIKHDTDLAHVAAHTLLRTHSHYYVHSGLNNKACNVPFGG